MAALEVSGLLDDTRVAEGRARELARRGYGNAAIRSDLERRRIPRDAVNAAIDALEPELERAQRLLDSRRPLPAVVRRLAARGFSRDTLDELAAAFAREA